MEELKKFLAAVQEDKDLQKKLVDTVKALPKGSSEDEISKCLIAVAKEAGYTVTMENLAGLKELVSKTDGEMEVNLEEMSQAAGGGGAGVTFSDCTGIGAGLTVTVTSSGGGFCIAVGGGKYQSWCMLYGMGNDKD